MKDRIKRHGITLLALLLMSLNLTAQQSNYIKQPGYWTLGINGGAAYQQGDIPIDWEGWGVGLTLAKNLYYQQGAPLSFDLRGRALYTQTYGLDKTRSFAIPNNSALNGTNGQNYTLTNPAYADAFAEGNLDRAFAYENYQTHMGELGLEGVFTFNKLREQTGVIFSLFGGLNLNGYYTGTDQRNFEGDYAADYLSIDPNLPSSLVRSTLKANVLDGSYETDANGFENGVQIDWMPSLGVELGYQVTPKFSVGLGHKVNFTRTDNFDGSMWDNAGNVTGDNDLHHYTNVHLRWEITPKERELPFPLITITNPRNNPHTTNNPNANIQAKIEHVNSAMDVTYTINGRNEQFSFGRTRFGARSILQPGRNEVIITAQNTVGSDQKKVVIFYQELIDNPPPPPVVRRPDVDITRPGGSSFTTQERETPVTARVTRVDNRRDIQVMVNGYTTSNFDFDRRAQQVTLNLPLRTGRNEVRITAQNPGGSDSDEVVIYREEAPDVPFVRITRPGSDPFYTSNGDQRIEADIEGVSRRDNIRFTVNGRRYSSFTFSGNRFGADVNLSIGRNTIRIEAVNEGGRADDETIIIVEEALMDAPRVRITDPMQDPYYTQNDREQIEAEILGIDRKSDIRMYINGRTTSDFNFSRTRLTANIALENGRTIIRIVAQNEAGADEDQTVIDREVADPNPAPQVKIVSTTQPTIDPLNPNNCKSTVIAEVEHVSRREDIEVRQNGRSVSGFTFSPTANTITYTAQLEQGANVIRIEVQNESGSDSDQTTIQGCFVQTLDEPKVEITQPNQDNTTVNTDKAVIEAQIEGIERKQDIDFYQNGRRMSTFNYNTYSRTLEASVTLKKGANTFRIVATNEAGTDEATVRIKYEQKIIIATPKKPVVKINTPDNRETVSKDRIALEAQVQHVSEKRDIQVLLNGRKSPNFTLNGDRVQATVTLKEGTNRIEVKANNKAGNDSDQVTVTFTKPVTIAKPKVTITKPSKSSITTMMHDQVIQATITGVESKSAIDLKFNGRKLTNFTFSKNQLSAEVTLNPGKNTVVIEATNKAGTGSDRVNFMHEAAKPTPPEVSILNPNNNSTLTEPKVSFKGQVKEVSKKSDITLKLNGKSVSSFNFSKGLVQTQLSLRPGLNTIQLSAKNADGSDQDDVRVTYTAPVAQPEATFVNPKKSGTTTDKSQASIKATVQHVKSEKDITLTVNGKKTSFRYNRKGGLTASIKLAKGKNTIKVTASNSAGQADAETVITYQSKDPKGAKPSVKIVSTSTPTVDPFDPNKGKTSVIAELQGVAAKSDIKLTVNGKAISNFSFDQKTKNLVSTISLVKGKNTIRIEGKNAFGSDSASKTVIF